MSENQNQVELLSVEEQDAIGKALFSLIKNYPGLNKIAVKYGDIGDNTIGIYAQSDAIVTKRYINGVFNAQFPFRLLYRSKPTTDNDRIAREETLGKLAGWLCKKNVAIGNKVYALDSYPLLSDGRKITEIEQLKTVSLAGRLADGNVDYFVNMCLYYKKKEEK